MKTQLATLASVKNIALIAHDNMKAVLADWALMNREALAAHKLYATGTTGTRLESTLNVPVQKFISGPLGGDQQIGAKISEGKIDVLIFFWDPFEPMPHDPDVKALLRLATAWNIPIATNLASADFFIHSAFFSKEYTRPIPDYESYMATRTSD